MTANCTVLLLNFFSAFDYKKKWTVGSRVYPHIERLVWGVVSYIYVNILFDTSIH